MGGERVVIVGVSTRAFAESARRAGFVPVCVDAFGDLDLRACAESIGMRRDLGRDYGAAAAVAVARRLEARAAAYVGNLENHPRAVARLAKGRELLGNAAAALAPARDFAALARVVRGAGARVPETLGPGAPAPKGRRWLRKPRRGGGGSGVRELAPGESVGTAELAQERIDGTLASLAFVADGRRARTLGVSHGLAGDPAFGARGHRYCGSLFPFAVPDRVRERLEAVAQAATQAFALVGLNGLDFVLRDDDVFVLELNPRYSASMELMERSGRFVAFAVHAAGCRGTLPAGSAPDPGEVFGKAVVWARRGVVLGDTRRWLARSDIRDVPFPGERVARGHPICTVFAQGRDAAECHGRLVETAAALEAELAREQAGA